ncbi:hypothetical protein HPB50_013766 [Hyalomma asiaticum]|uniref:Uncharacterized protein n=1 Tax=Hyalomma asiaticum TaxID=266040 RepID=A0ACB7SME2_HYAAI|nr:hypothetical protein HPB50_013766 [Hyalomma asiaticum]
MVKEQQQRNGNADRSATIRLPAAPITCYPKPPCGESARSTLGLLLMRAVCFTAWLLCQPPLSSTPSAQPPGCVLCEEEESWAEREGGSAACASAAAGAACLRNKNARGMTTAAGGEPTPTRNRARCPSRARL